jgi:hypothetical protein
MGRIGKRTGLGMVIGFVVGVAAGLILALVLHKHDHAFWGFVLIPTIFGIIVGAFIGGISSLSDPAPGQEPADPAD